MALQNVRSNTANKRPTAAGLSAGQIALNTNATEPGLFFEDASGDIVKIGPIAVGSSAPNSSPATGGSTGNSKGEAWLDTSTTPAILKIYDGTAWFSSSSLPLAGGTLTGQVLLDDAQSATAPDLAFDGDTNTGIFSPASDKIAIATGGTQRVVVDALGNVGIAKASPSSALDVSGTIKATTVDATTVDGDTITVNTKIELANKEKSDLGADGELSFDSSQGLIVYRTQQGVTGTAVTVLDGANVQAGSNIDITNLGGGSGGTGRIVFSVNSTNLDADTVDDLEASQFLRSDQSDSTTGTLTAPSFAVTGGGTITDSTGNYGSVKVTGGATGGYKGYAIDASAVFMDNGTSFGLYDDTNNHWALKHTKNGATNLYYDGNSKLATSSAGGTLTGTWTGTVSNATNATSATNADTVDGLHASAFVKSNADNTGTGGYSTSGSFWEVGEGSGGVALTLNDGYGNANVTFNHRNGTPDQNGNSARIEVNTDSTSEASISFEVKSNVTNNTAVSLTEAMKVRETFVNFPVGLSFDGGTNKMDEYEEGTFTPEYDPASNPVSGWNPNYDRQNGHYIRIGNVCHFRIRLRTDSVGTVSSTGAIDVSGLPFQARGTSPQAVSIYSNGFPNGDHPYMAYVNTSSTRIYIYKMNATLGNAPVRMTYNDFGNGINDNAVYITGSYQVP